MGDFLKKYKRLFLFIIPLILLAAFSIIFYFTSKKNSFDSFCNELFIQEIDSDTLNLHYTLAHPEDFGIKQKEASLPFYQKDAALANYQNLQEYCNTLQTFETETLNKEEQYTHSLLSKSFSEELKGKEYFYLQEVFSPSGGIQIQYPILMAEYAFRCKEDIENYLSLIKLTPSYFESYCDFTSEKVKRGFGMPDFSLDKVINQCQTIITQKELDNQSHFMISTFNERLQKAQEDGIISEPEAAAYSSQNTQYLSQYFLPAYETLKDTLSQFYGKGKNAEGLSHFKDGCSYYEWLFKRTTGSDTALTDVYQTLAKDYYNSMLKLRDDLILFQDSSSLTEEDFSYFTLTESEEMLKNLTEQMKSDFPAVSSSFNVPALSATIKDVNTSLEKFTAPAYYLVPPIDDNSRNSIYINQSSAPAGLELYTTLAHEGCPGHLYQTTYYQLYRDEHKLPYLRSTLNYGGYVEGWALYVELLSYDYAKNLLIHDTGKEDYRLLYDIFRQERRASLALLSLLDVGIHYYGISYDRVKELLETHGIMDENAITEIYQYIVEEPANYPKYYWSYLEILSLKDEFKKHMGEYYSDYAFHQFYLESGPSDFTSLKNRIKEN